jgi:hypothetical protein
MEAAFDVGGEARMRGRLVAKANTWEQRADRFLEIVRDVVDSRGARASNTVKPALSGAA